MLIRSLPILLMLIGMTAASAQPPPLDEGGVSHELAKWRAARYSDVRYKLNLTLEKMSPVLKGTMEIRVNVSPGPQAPSPASTLNNDNAGARETRAFPAGDDLAIVLDWRKIPGHETKSTISNVLVNGKPALFERPKMESGGVTRYYADLNEHLIFYDNVIAGENVIKLDFTSPILTSGSAITRYIDKEDGSEYIYSLFVPSDASTAFPVFDQPDLKGKFTLSIATIDDGWSFISNEKAKSGWTADGFGYGVTFAETKAISTYVFAFAAGPWQRVAEPPASAGGENAAAKSTSGPNTECDTHPAATPPAYAGGSALYVRKSQAAKFQPHAAEMFRLNREAIRHLETYFDYKFPFPKYDLVLIPEFPFGGMEHAGATFLRESSIIFPTEPTKGDYISRANLIFHEAAHQWFGDTVTMRWFDDLWLKEGFAEFMAYKTLEKVMPDANAWKVFYERNKQAAYQTDSTRGTTPIYQPIRNLSAAKSAYGNIVYRKAPSFLKQAEFYLGADNFQKAVRAFLKKNEFGNAGWEDLVREFESVAGDELKTDFAKVQNQSIEKWAKTWVEGRGMSVFRVTRFAPGGFYVLQESPLGEYGSAHLKFQIQVAYSDGAARPEKVWMIREERMALPYMLMGGREIDWIFPNYQDYGYGIFLLDDKSRGYILKNIQNEKDPFLRSMMWGALWDSVRETELDPRVYVELAIKELGGKVAEARAAARAVAKDRALEDDETIVASLLGRVSTALNYYLPSSDTALANARASATSRSTSKMLASETPDLRSRFEAMLLDRLQNAPTPGQRVTFFRAFVNNASTPKSRIVLKEMLRQSAVGRVSEPPAVAGGLTTVTTKTQGASGSKTAGVQPPATAGGTDKGPTLPLKTKDRFDIVTRLAVLNDPDAPRLLAEIEKTETTDDAKRYAYIARAAFPTAANKAKFWNDFVNNKDLSESWIEGAVVPFNSIRHAPLTQPYLQRALAELPTLKRTRKIFFINNWLSAWLSGQRNEAALDIVNRFLADNPQLDNDLRLKILENLDLIERSVKIRKKWNY